MYFKLFFLFLLCTIISYYLLNYLGWHLSFFEISGSFQTSDATFSFYVDIFPFVLSALIVYILSKQKIINRFTFHKKS
ncbi:hypothetical protein ABD68_00130 [Bacillus endophyticus]|nr:hypothetical protein [Priestia endophytica]